MLTSLLKMSWHAGLSRTTGTRGKTWTSWRKGNPTLPQKPKSSMILVKKSIEEKNDFHDI